MSTGSQIVNFVKRQWQKVAEEVCIWRVAGYGWFYWRVGRTPPAGRRSLVVVVPVGRIHSVCCGEEKRRHVECLWLRRTRSGSTPLTSTSILQITTARKTLRFGGICELNEATNKLVDDIGIYLLTTLWIECRTFAPGVCSIYYECPETFFAVKTVGIF